MKIQKTILPQIIISSLIAAAITAGIVSAATTIGTNISTGGTLSVTGTTTFRGVDYVWPSADGSASAYLQTDGSGALSWAAITAASPDWIKETNYGVLNLTASSTIPYWAKDAIYASSTLTVQGLTTLATASTTGNATIGDALADIFYLNSGTTSYLNNSTSTIQQNINSWSLATSDTATPILSVDGSNGRVGIGTTNPGAELEVSGSYTIIKALYTDGTTDIHFEIQGSGSTAIDTGYQDELSINTSNAIRMSFSGTSDNIGVSDSGPDAIFEVSGSGGSTDLFMVSSDDNNDGDRLVVKNSGNVGIGTTSPSQTLHVLSATATTTVEFGDISSSTAKTCFNVNATDGSAGSFYFDSTNGIIFESNACK